MLGVTLSVTPAFLVVALAFLALKSHLSLLWALVSQPQFLPTVILTRASCLPSAPVPAIWADNDDLLLVIVVLVNQAGDKEDKYYSGNVDQ